MIFLVLVRLVLACVGWYTSLWLYPLLPNASWYKGAALWNSVWLEEMLLSLLFMPAGRFLIMLGGWLLFLCTYKMLFPGFVKGLYDLELRSNVTSKKSTTFLFASIVILRLCFANAAQIFVSWFFLLFLVRPRMPLVRRPCINLRCS